MAEHPICVAVITCRPDSLRQLVQHLEHLALPSLPVELLVVDNDPAGSAGPIVAAIPATYPLAVRYVAEPQRGIPYARNRALLEAANADYLAFLDDDDRPEPSWLCALYDTLLRSSADIVCGHLAYSFPEGMQHLAALDIFAPRMQQTGDQLASAWSGNVLFKTAVYRDTDIRFDPRFVRSGGSDHHFFSQLAARGARIVFCREAVVVISVPPARARWRWIARRHFRVGATLTQSDMLSHGRRRAVRNVAHALKDSAGYSFRLLRGVCQGSVRFIHPAMVMVFMLGRVAGLMGLTGREYR